MVVIDASAWVRALADSSDEGMAVRKVFADHFHWFAPAHAPLEVLRTLRRYEMAGALTRDQAAGLVQATMQAEVSYFGSEQWLLEACWGLRHNLSIYDAPYVALAQRFDLPLVTFDSRLATAASQLGVDTVIPASA